MAKLIDLTGMRFGRLEVIERVPYVTKGGNPLTAYRCKCDCGNTKIVIAENLRKERVISCGCYKDENTAKRSKTHGMSKTRLYHIWGLMKKRCNDPHSINYERYGGRGITVCDEWQKSSDAFLEWALSHGYREDLTLDRIENDKGYSPENCRWATAKEQGRNQRTNRRLTMNGETRTLSEWVEITGINDATIRSRLKRGWNVERALSEPVDRSKRTYLCKRPSAKEI